MKRYNFKRFLGVRQMAEGIAVHANSLPEASQKANRLLENRQEWLEFSGNRKCAPLSRCRICQKGN